jgi:hypothetical protein
MNKGRKRDVLIEAVSYTDPRTGVHVVSDRDFTVWADEGMNDVILGVEGVTAVYSGQPKKTQYHVYVDARYDIEFIKAEVEATIKCREEGTK